ncbi:Uncharacterized protein Adt_37144 [Abeliophyllum distichum]|uniref:Uncharacterized protein n=1 Tax=Abeliophyllum distichum TaxID=126358 RepID=A0ABD1QLL9_9LAMI
MDFKIKGKTWVGNICHRFESMCNEVDDFISKDTVKYVENQVQIVGLGVKRFYSNVVQDILPPLEGTVKSEEWEITGKQVDMKDFLNSTIGIKGKPDTVHEKQLPMEQGPFDTQRNNNPLMPSKLDHEGQCTTTPAADSCEEAEIDLPLEQDGDGIISNNSDKVVVENITRDSMPMIVNSSSVNKILSVTSSYSNGDHNNTTLAMVSSQAPSVHKAGLIAFPNEGILNNSFSDDRECGSDISSTGWESELDLPSVEDSNSDEDRSLSVPPAVSVDKGQKDNVMVMDSSTFSADDADCRTSEKDGPLSDNFPTEECFNVSSSTVQSPELVVSIFSCDNEEAVDGVISSSCSMPPKSSNFSELTFAKLAQKADNIFDPHVDSIDCIYDQSDNHTSSVSSTTAACETRTPDFIPAFSSSVSLLESNDVNTSTTHGSVFVVQPSGSWQENCCDGPQSNLSMSPAEIGNIHEPGGGISYSNMASVDLSNKVEHDGSCAIVNGNSVYGNSCKGRSFRYYKNLIKDAFGSHKRLTKEYEHLAILYGDIDQELWQHFEPSSLPSTPTASSLFPRSPSHETSKSDWELL